MVVENEGCKLASFLSFVPRYVLTAAHCFCGGILLDCDSSTQFPAHPWIIHLEEDNKGKARARSPAVKVDFLAGGGRVDQDEFEDNDEEGNMQSITVRRVIVYEKYVQASNLISDGDVALLELQGLPHRITRSATSSVAKVVL